MNKAEIIFTKLARGLGTFRDEAYEFRAGGRETPPSIATYEAGIKGEAEKVLSRPASKLMTSMGIGAGIGGLTSIPGTKVKPTIKGVGKGAIIGTAVGAAVRGLGILGAKKDIALVGRADYSSRAKKKLRDRYLEELGSN